MSATGGINFTTQLREYVMQPELVEKEPEKVSAFFKAFSFHYFSVQDQDEIFMLKRLLRARFTDLSKHFPIDTIMTTGTTTRECKGLCLALRYATIDQWIRKTAGAKQAEHPFEVTITEINADDLEKLIAHAERGDPLPDKLESYKTSLNLYQEKHSPRLRPRKDPDEGEMVLVKRKSSGNCQVPTFQREDSI